CRTGRSLPRTGCTWTSNPSTAIRRPSSAACSPLVRGWQTSAKVIGTGSSWPTPRGTSSAFAVLDGVRRNERDHRPAGHQRQRGMTGRSRGSASSRLSPFTAPHFDGRRLVLVRTNDNVVLV